MIFPFYIFKKYSLFIFIILCCTVVAVSQNNDVETSKTLKASPSHLKNYVNTIIHDPTVYRNYKNVAELNRVAVWLKEQMQQFGLPCQYQNYQVDGQTYRNVVCLLDQGSKEKVIVGAHYDVFDEQDGADDNASGVAGVLETARVLMQQKANVKKNVEFVFYTLEEPPYFRTEQMGSYIHAKSIDAHKDQVLAVYILEMIGYFSEDAIQTYPTGLGLFYPSHGNFIAAISNFSSRNLSARFCEKMKNLDKLQCERLIAPAFVYGVDFSDHGNYWKFNIPAIMITDTAFFRNENYHLKTDQVSQLNFNKMADVVNGLVETILSEK